MKNLRLKSDEILVLRTCGANGKSYGGFKWPFKGKVKAPDWIKDFNCGHGLHGLPWGEGSGGLLNWRGNNGWVVKVSTNPEGYCHGREDMVDKCKFQKGEVVLSQASCEDCIKLIQEHCPANTKVNWAAQIGGDEVVQTAGSNSTQKAGSNSTQTAGSNSTQMAADDSTQKAGDNSTQMVGSNSTQTAGDNSTQTAEYNSTQKAADNSTQKAADDSTQMVGSNSTQTAGDNSTQTAESNSTQTAGSNSTQTAGIGTVQITRWYDGEWKVATRIVTKKEADKKYRVSRGAWTLVES